MARLSDTPPTPPSRFRRAKWPRLLAAACLGLGLIAAKSAPADTVRLKVLVVSVGTPSEDAGLDYIDDVLNEMGVPYDVLDSSRQTLTAARLSAGTAGNYNGVILTSADLFTPTGSGFTPAEWTILQTYEKTFGVREAVLGGFPGTYNLPGQAPYLDYGMGGFTSGSSFIGQWTIPVTLSRELYEYVRTTKTLPVTDFAIGHTPCTAVTCPPNPALPRTLPVIQPLLKVSGANSNLVSLLTYTYPDGKKREVLLSSISNAWFLLHSQVLAYEFVSFATKGVFVGSRFTYMAAHLDDLFIANQLWDTANDRTFPDSDPPNPNEIYRLTGADIVNGVAQQNAFRAAHPTAGTAFKLDFPFNGAGAVVDPLAATPVANLTEDLVASVMANRTQFRFINHTFSHADMDRPPVPANPPPPAGTCDYETLPTVTAIRQEITKNRTVWQALGLPERAQNNRVLVSGNHSGLKDRKCTDNVLTDDVEFQTGANPLFFQAAAFSSVDYLAADSSQPNQNVEHYATQVNDGSNLNRLLLPRYPTSVFVNVVEPAALTDEYNWLFYGRFVNQGQDPCTIAGAICAPRTYAEILNAEADTAVRHMLSYRKWPHFFHQSNLKKYDTAGNTLQFDWLNAVFARYESLFRLPVKNLPYYQIGDLTA